MPRPITDTVVIRPETPADIDAIRELVREAFLTAPHAEGDEHVFVDRQRASAGYVPALALVAQDVGRLVGYVMATRIHADTTAGRVPVLLLAELAVAQPARRQGLGAALLTAALEAARSLGFEAVILVGDPAYYGRFGFGPSIAHGLANANGIEDEYVLTRALAPGALAALAGVVSLPQ